MTTKLTKKDFYNALINYATNGTMEIEKNDETYEITADELLKFAKREIELIDNKAAKAKERASKTTAATDALSEKVANVLTDEFQSIADVVILVNDDDATLSKVTYRLNALVKAGTAEKGEIKIPGGDGQKTRKITGYRLAGGDNEDE